MDEHLASVIWDELKRYINTVDRAEAAESLVSILIDNDADAEDIKSAFAGDKDIKNALTNYINDETEEEYEEEEEEEDFQEDWDD